MTTLHPETTAASVSGHNPGGFTIDSFGRAASGGGATEKDKAQQRLVMGVAAAVIVVAAAFGGWRTYSESRNGAARDALYLAEKEWSKAFATVSPSGATGSKDPAAAEKAALASQYKVLDVDSLFPAAVKAFSDVVEKFSGTRASFDAAMTLGGHYFDHGAPANAATWFEKAASMASGADRDGARLALAQAQESAGKLAEARSAYAALAESASPRFKGEGLLGLAGIARTEGKPAEAREAYERIRKELSGSAAAGQASSLLTTLK